MTNPKIDIRYIDGCDMDEPDHGYIMICINHERVAEIYTDFTTGNTAQLHIGLKEALESAYERGVKDGVKRSKERINDLLEWAKRIDDAS